VTGTFVIAPQIGARALILTRVGLTLIFSWTSWLSVNLLYSAIFFREIVLDDFNFVDDNVLDATNKGRGVVGQDLLVAHNAADESVEEHSVVVSGGINRLRGLQTIVYAES